MSELLFQLTDTSFAYVSKYHRHRHELMKVSLTLTPWDTGDPNFTNKEKKATGKVFSQVIKPV